MSVYDRILITGANGMLAKAFRRRLLPLNLNINWVDRQTLDIVDEPACARLFEQFQPTLVINCAAYTKVDLAEKEPDLACAVNGNAVGYLARLCQKFGTMLVHYSTDYVFDGTIRRPLLPNDPIGPLSQYGKSKLLGEQLLQRNAPSRWLLIRTAWLYGPDGACFPATILKLAREGKPLKVIHDQHGSPTFTDDLVHATLELIHREAPSGIWHLTNSGQTTWFEFARAILNEFGLKTDLTSITSQEWKKMKPDSAIRPGYSVLDLSAYEAFTREPMPRWEEALHRYKTIIQP
ncbi:MAG: spore coat polysaccharide biosynthesis protein SpsK [Phycisphaerae bacterium]|jgi:dTDP-4-dehydrorhamnose reductase|nr:MAG: spore coat polysaccharide biosynthesis protein SpsK [Phycisphaerae bacterium]